MFEFFLLQSFQILQTGTPQKQELYANDYIDVVGALFKQMPSNPIIVETVKKEFKNLHSSYGYVLIDRLIKVISGDIVRNKFIGFLDF